MMVRASRAAAREVLEDRAHRLPDRHHLGRLMRGVDFLFGGSENDTLTAVDVYAQKSPVEYDREYARQVLEAMIPQWKRDGFGFEALPAESVR